MLNSSAMRQAKHKNAIAWMALAFCICSCSLISCEKAGELLDLEALETLKAYIRQQVEELGTSSNEKDPNQPAGAAGQAGEPEVHIRGESASSEPGKIDANADPDDGKIYRWIDDGGIHHIVSGIKSVPPQYRRRAELIESVRPPEPKPDRSPRKKTRPRSQIDPDPFNNPTAEREATRKRWRRRYQDAMKAVKRIEAQIKKMERNKSFCHSYDLDDSEYTEGLYSETSCCLKWKAKRRTLNERLKNARRGPDQVREQGRKAGIPPGVFR